MSPHLLTGALVLALLALPGRASAQESFARRAEIPDAHLRGVTHVVCATFPQDATPEVPVYEHRGLGFRPAGAVPRAQTAPLSRWADPRGWQEDCFPAFEHERLNEHGVPVQYALAILDMRSGRKAWIRDGGADDSRSVWVTIESLRPLEAFEDKGVEFFKLRREGQPALVFREGPRDDACPVDISLHDEQVILGKRAGDFAEVLVFDEAGGQYRPRGWVRLVDAEGLLLLWPANYPSHGC